MKQDLAQITQLLSSGQADKAEALLATELEKTSPSPRIHSLYAHSLLHQGKLQQAISHLEEVIEKNGPGIIQLSADLGGIFLKIGNFGSAIRYLNSALTHAPNSDQLWHLLGIAQYRIGDKTQAYISFAKAEQHDPFKEHLIKAEKAIENGDKETCSRNLNSILAEFPAHPQANFLFASMLLQNGHIEQAAEHVSRALTYSPYHQNLWQMMAQIQIQFCDMQAALASGKKLVEMDPKNPKHHQLLADIQQNCGKLEEAVQSYKNAVKAGAEGQHALLQIAHLKQSLGDNVGAIKDYRTCTTNPDLMGSAFWGLNTISSYRLSQEELDTLEKAQLDPDINVEQACQASFALARVKENEEKYPAAFKQYLNANTLKAGTRYSPSIAEQKFASIKSVFSRELLSNPSGYVDSNVTPIFIVGLPRSGSTLTEQILASHSEVEATMELKVMPAVARRAFNLSCKKQKNSRGDVSSLSKEEFIHLGDYYMKLSEVYRTDKAYFIDKLPPNYQHVGLIKKILPQAIIIDTRRHPMAWGLAVFRQYFAQGHDYSYDLPHIGHAYFNYLDLMTHWKQCLGDKVFTLQYEELVTDTEKQVRALLEHCQLNFEAACLAPHKHQRYVHTASSDQVRKPIYQSAVNSWKKYQQQLEPLAETLRQYKVRC